MKKFSLKIPYRYREIVKKQKKLTVFAQSPSIGFKWEIGCTVPKNSNKSDVIC